VAASASRAGAPRRRPRPIRRRDRITATVTSASGLPCPECGAPQDYDHDTARLACSNGQCARLWMDTPVWRALEDAGAALAPVTGLPRPVRDGLPVPWVTPWTATRVWWRALDGRRLAAAHVEWRCQVCGEPLPERAWVLASPSGAVLQAALHEECLALARRFCPHLSGPATRASAHQVTRDQLTSGGRPLPQAVPSDPDFLLQQWELAAADRPEPQPARPDSPAAQA
jgi:hypothetical protein